MGLANEKIASMALTIIGAYK